MDSPYAKELSLCIRAIQAAARLSQSLISPRQDKGALEKDDLSPVTVADFAVQALLIATVRRSFPEDGFVGEEDASALRDNDALLGRVWHLLREEVVVEEEEREKEQDGSRGIALPESKDHLCELLDLAGRQGPSKTGRTWIFDPIDGTKTYLRGELYAINMALLVDGTQTVACVGCPNMAVDAAAPLTDGDVDAHGQGCIVYAVRGHGAFATPMHAPRPLAGRDHDHLRRLPPVSPGSESDIRFVSCVSPMVDSALDGGALHAEIATRLGAPFPGCNLLAWVLRWTTLALGLANTTVWVYKRRDRRGKVWDHAGAMLLFEETGGKITDLAGRDMDLTAGRSMVANFGFVAAPRHLHGRVISLVRDVLTERGHAEMLA
ncbi:hypothetical protein E4U41_004928 [Claviceps citrina]|nr:hypothetical protein E4U41_004928 [Claviceps citrina]